MSEHIWKIKFYGVRGSIPVSSPSVKEFGGNTTCFYLDFLVKEPKDKVIVVFDAGTGIRQLGKDIMSGLIGRTEHILMNFTHFHWDHIQGLPFFAPAYLPDQKIAFFSPHFLNEDADKLHEVFKGQMQSKYFPVQLDKMGADMHFFTSEHFKDSLKLDEQVKFSYHQLNHPGSAFGYRLDGYGKSVVICTDVEHGEQVNPEIVEFCRDADLLIHEAQYTDEQLVKYRGWGHSSFNQAIEVAERANVKNLYITHHDPDHNDDFLRSIEAQCQQRFANCFLAREGQEVLV